MLIEGEHEAKVQCLAELGQLIEAEDSAGIQIIAGIAVALRVDPLSPLQRNNRPESVMNVHSLFAWRIPSPSAAVTVNPCTLELAAMVPFSISRNAY